ncbi:MAG: hypothetical protein ACREBU_11065, partial [Nitrososphaera sp.]
DKPWIATDTRDPSSPYRDNVYVCWTKFDDPAGTQKTMFKRIWPNAGPIRQVSFGYYGTEHPGTGEDALCQVTVGVDGIVYVTWQRLNNPDIAKIQLKRSFNGGESFETLAQTVITFGRFLVNYGSNCPQELPGAPPKLWGCLKGISGSGIETPAVHSTAVDTLAYNVHVAYSSYDASTLADIRYIQGTNCSTPEVACDWLTPSVKIVKDGNLARDQFDPAITVSPDTYTIHVTAMDRRNSAGNTSWRPFHYHCHFASSDCKLQASWYVVGISTINSNNFDLDEFIGHYHGITTSAAREADTIWTDTRFNLFNQDRNIFGDRLI